MRAGASAGRQTNPRYVRPTAGPNHGVYDSVVDAIAVAARSLASSRAAGVLGRAVIPVVGVLLFGWDAWALILLYWFETWFAGVDGLLRIGIAEGIPDPSSGEPALDESQQGKLQVTFALGCFASMLFASAVVFTFVPRTLGNPGGGLDAPLVFLLAVIASALAERRAYRRFIETGEYLRVTPMSQGKAPMKRISVLWFTVVMAVIVGLALPGLARPLIVILGKGAAELAAELEIGPFETAKG